MPDKKTNKDSHENGDKEINKDTEGKKVDEKKLSKDPGDSKEESKQQDEEKKPVEKHSLKTPQEGKDKISDHPPKKKTPGKKKHEEKAADSNYQVSLVDENTLKIKIKTDKSISLNSKVGGKDVLPEEVEGILNKLGTGKEGEIEIEISINPEKKPPVVDTGKEDKDKKEEEKGALIPNPEVAAIVDKKIPLEEEIELTDEDILREKIGRKSPFNIAKKIYAQNFQIGLISGVIIYLIGIFSFYAVASKEKIVDENPGERLIIIQDLPDPKINLENIEDPNAPPKEEDSEDDGIVPKRIPIKRNFNRPPVVKNPGITEDTDTTLTRDTTGFADTTTTSDTSTASGNPVPDSLMADYTGEGVGIKMRYPNSWVVRDPSSINTNLPQDAGLVLADTTIGEGDMNIFVHVDDDGTDFKKDKFTTPFEMEDSTLTTFTADIRNDGGRNTYKFYVFGKEKKLFIEANVREKHFEKYKPIIESVVRSITFIQKPQ